MGDNPIMNFLAGIQRTVQNPLPHVNFADRINNPLLKIIPGFAQDLINTPYNAQQGAIKTGQNIQKASSGQHVGLGDVLSGALPIGNLFLTLGGLGAAGKGLEGLLGGGSQIKNLRFLTPQTANSSIQGLEQAFKLSQKYEQPLGSAVYRMLGQGFIGDQTANSVVKDLTNRVLPQFKNFNSVDQAKIWDYILARKYGNTPLNSVVPDVLKGVDKSVDIFK